MNKLKDTTRKEPTQKILCCSPFCRKFEYLDQPQNETEGFYYTHKGDVYWVCCVSCIRTMSLVSHYVDAKSVIPSYFNESQEKTHSICQLTKVSDTLLDQSYCPFDDIFIPGIEPIHCGNSECNVLWKYPMNRYYVSTFATVSTWCCSYECDTIFRKQFYE